MSGRLVLLNLLTRGTILDRLYASVYDAGSKSTLHMNILICNQKPRILILISFVFILNNSFDTNFDIQIFGLAFKLTQGSEWVLAKKSEKCVMPSLMGDAHGSFKELGRIWFLVGGFGGSPPENFWI